MIERQCDVNILMATYNDNLFYLEKAIDSILNQSYKDYKFIIVDDSTNTDVINYLTEKSVIDKRILYIHNDEKLGFVKSLNKGLEFCEGKYIARMDSDDISDIFRIEKQYNYLEENPGIDVLGVNISIIDENNKFLSNRIYFDDFNKIKKKMFFRSPVAHPSVMMRKSIFNKIYGYNPKFKMGEDYDLWLRLIKQGYVFSNLQEILFTYRMPKNYSKNRSKKHWKFVLKSRIENFMCRYFFKNIIGIILAFILYIVPNKIISLMYDIDKKKSKVALVERGDNNE